MDHVLTIENLHFSYPNSPTNTFQESPKQQVLQNISFNLKKGEILGIIGPNGGGKSTLMQLLVGRLAPSSGHISLKGTVSYIPQIKKLNLLLPITVEDLLHLGYETTEGKKSSSKNLRTKKIQELLELFSLTHKKKFLVRELSGGERQRALLAQALMRDPDLLFLDEPGLGLDSTGLDQLLKILEELKTKHQKTIVIIDHHLPLVSTHADYILCLNKTQHWHNKKELLSQKIISSIYHCEFEHQNIHEKGHMEEEHKQCDTHHAPKNSSSQQEKS